MSNVVPNVNDKCKMPKTVYVLPYISGNVIVSPIKVAGGLGDRRRRRLGDRWCLENQQ